MALAPPAAAEAVRELLDALEGVSAVMALSLDEVAWPDTDCLWLHDVRATSPALGGWLEGGGRLLATLDAALVPVDLGLESVPPDEVRDSRWECAAHDDAPRGMAAFGPHPLFDGLQQGACTWAPVAGELYRWAVYLASRPGTGQVVAVERRGLEVNPVCVVAWEYSVGQGGLLCIGSGVCPDAPDQRWAPQLRALIGNALGRSGIPHRDRPPGARHWPVPGQKVLRRDLAPVPQLPGLEGDWADSPAALALDHSVGSDESWVLAGRRGVLTGSEGGGLAEAWLHPFRALRDAALSVAGSLPTPSRIRITPDQVTRWSEADGTPVVERWLVALEHPVLFWQVDPGAPRPVLLEWSVDLRRAWPYPAACGGDLELSVAPSGRHAMLRAVGDPFRLIVDVEGGTLEAAPLEGPGVRFSVRAVGRCRVRLLGAADDADLERSRQMLARRGWAGLQAQREEHACSLATYATSIEVPEPALVEAFEWAKVRMDGCLVGAPGVGRCLSTGYARPAAGRDRPGAARYVGADACRTALAQLAAGDRGGPRDTLQFLSLTQGVDGRLIEECSTSGLALHGIDGVTPFYLLLAARYAAWTGELDFLARRWSAIRRALDAGLAAPPWTRAATWVTALEALQPLAEALGHPETAEELSGHAAAARAAGPGGADLVDAPCLDPFMSGRFEDGLGQWRTLALAAPCPDDQARTSVAIAAVAVEGLWGVRPNALEGAVRIAPWFPPGWDTMALDRLRVGRTVLSVRMRRRFAQVAARIDRVHGPRLHVDFELRGAPASEAVTLDDVELRGGRVAFEAEGTHALVWHA